MQTIKTIKVRPFNSPRSGKPVPNQLIITTPEGTYFQSYQSIVAFKGNDGRVTLDHDTREYSKTTGKYRNEFLNEGVADTRKKIESGEYELADLNAGRTEDTSHQFNASYGLIADVQGLTTATLEEIRESLTADNVDEFIGIIETELESREEKEA